MADTYTTNLNLTKPEPGAAEDTWGISLNADLDALDAIFSSSGTQINLNPNQINFADGKKAVFNSNLNIFSTGTSSYIEEVGTGDLYLKASNLYITDRENNQFMSMVDNGTGGTLSLKHLGSTVLTTTSSGIDVTGTVTADGIDSSGNFNFTAADGIEIAAKETVQIRIDSDDNDSNRLFSVVSGSNASKETLIQASEDAGVSLYYDNAVKLATTSSGIDVTGTTVTDGLTVSDGTNGIIQVGALNTRRIAGGSAYGGIRYYSDNDHILYTNNVQRLAINSGGDISFYDDTGSTQGLFWDASAERLAIGNTAPTQALDVTGAITSSGNIFMSTNGSILRNTGGALQLQSDASQVILRSNNTTALTLDTSQNATFAGAISAEDNIYLTDAGTTRGRIELNASDRDDLDIVAVSLSSNLKFFTQNTEVGRFDASGNFGVGTTAPAEKLTVSGNQNITGKLAISTV